MNGLEVRSWNQNRKILVVKMVATPETMSWQDASNTTSPPNTTTCSNLYDHRATARVLMPLHYALVFTLGFLGNALALHVIRPNLAKINSTTLYSANLAISDIMFTLSLPLRIAYYAFGFHWPLGEGLCQITALLCYANTYAGVNFMTCMAADRFVAVVLPRRYPRLRQARTVRYICVGVWVLVLVQTLPLLSMRMTRLELDGTTTCMEYPNFEDGVVEGLPYILISAVVMGYGIPVLIILCCYSALLWRLRLLTGNGITGKGQRSGRNRKASGVIMWVVLVFVLCFSPYHINILQYMIRKLRYSPNCTELQAFQVSLHITVCLMHLNTCLDPFVYFFACKGYKRKVLRMMKFQLSTSFSSVVRTGEDVAWNRGESLHRPRTRSQMRMSSLAGVPGPSDDAIKQESPNQQSPTRQELYPPELRQELFQADQVQR
uniref:G-protein coupled receptors family 1 profile domain-containing protein n=1 Tax=Esox lucius TaxID=8010 RepID=A0A3P8ZDS5_ESOLU